MSNESDRTQSGSPDPAPEPARPTPPRRTGGAGETVPAPAGGSAGRAGTPIPGTAYSGNSSRGYAPPPQRTSAQIRADIEAQRTELGQSVDQLRDKVTDLTDWRGQLRKHRKEVTIAAVATGFVIGGLMALRRRR